MSADRIAAYQDDIGYLWCPHCANDIATLIPVTAEDLSEGGVCDSCDVDLLIDGD